MPESRGAPWKQKNPVPKAARVQLTPANRAEARARARRAGRPYPNLVDNLQVAREQKKKAD